MTTSYILANDLIEFNYRVEKKDQKIIAASEDKILLSNDCSTSCMARVALSKSKEKKYPTKIDKSNTHDASLACVQLGGINQIVNSKDDKQYDFCFFKDKSFIDSWRLIN